MVDVRARVRGIYSTALVKMLLDHGATVCEPSVRQVEKFPELARVRSEPNVWIMDRGSKQGVRIFGDYKAVEATCALIKSELYDCIVWDISSNHRMRIVKTEFPYVSKNLLDKLRAKVEPTIERHHYYKACGPQVSSLVDMAEKLMAEGRDAKIVAEDFKRLFIQSMPSVGKKLEIQHVKLDGQLISLGLATVEDYDPDLGKIKLRRSMSGEGMYDGLNVPKEKEDYAITEIKEGEWSFMTSYYSSSGKIKGSYVNLNTPVEIYPDHVRYVDLEVDVVKMPDGEVRVIDEDKLEDCLRADLVSQHLYDNVKSTLKNVLDNL